jgi:hypothetical protein
MGNPFAATVASLPESGGKSTLQAGNGFSHAGVPKGHIVKRQQRAFKIRGLTWIVERTFAWLGRKTSIQQGPRVSGANVRDSFHAQSACTEAFKKDPHSTFTASWGSAFPQ